MLNRRDVQVERELERDENDRRTAAAVPQFLADALAWMEIQRLGLDRLRQYQYEEAFEAVSDGAGRRPF